MADTRVSDALRRIAGGEYIYYPAEARDALPLALELEQQVESLRKQLVSAYSERDHCVLELSGKVESLRSGRDAALRSADLFQSSADVWEQTAKLGRNLMSCGHQEMWAYSHDGGKNGFCLLCRNAERDALLADKERLLKILDKIHNASRLAYDNENNVLTPVQVMSAARHEQHEIEDAARKPVSQEPTK